MEHELQTEGENKETQQLIISVGREEEEFINIRQPVTGPMRSPCNAHEVNAYKSSHRQVHSTSVCMFNLRKYKISAKLGA
jgi:hypothetical protein